MKPATLIVAALLLSGATHAQTEGTLLSIEKDSLNELSLEKTESGVYQMVTRGEDPYLYTRPLQRPMPDEHQVLSFEYFCAKGLDHLHIWFGSPISDERSKLIRQIGPSEGWVNFAVDLSEDLGDWGQKGSVLRLDLGDRPDVNIQIRNFMLR